MAQLWPGCDSPGLNYITAPPSLEWQTCACRHVVVLGSTGSIGSSALSVIDRNPKAFVIEGLACATQVEKLFVQALRYRPPCLAVLNEASAEKLRALLPAGYLPEIFIGPDGYRKIARLESCDTVLSAQSGAAGLVGTLSAALAGKVICLANKESLVLAGDLLRYICALTKAVILPVDSEHFALFSCLAGRGADVDHLIITASGGPFRGMDAARLETVTPAMALKHPNWNMGAKITIDSATLMNKGLELIEACQLYGVTPERVKVLVHPQSIVHSLVAFRDGSIAAQLAVPDMRLPIGACLLWPNVKVPLVEPLDLVATGPLTFERVDLEAFPALTLARRAMQVREGMSVVFNNADEAAVDLFLHGKCSFPMITRSVGAAMEEHLRRLKLQGGADGLPTPFSVSGSILTLRGASLERATEELLDGIRDLGHFAQSFVQNYVASGGTYSCF